MSAVQAAPAAAPVTGRPRVIGVYEPRLQTTSVCLAVAHGARQDPQGGCGVAHLLEHLLFSLPSGGDASFAERIERNGGQANAETGVETMLFYAQVAAEDARQTASDLLRSVLRPELDNPGLLDREREVVVKELMTASADPADSVQDAVVEKLFPGHPMARPIGGRIGELADLTVDDVVREHRGRFLRSPMALVVVGPSPVDGLDEMLAEALPAEASGAAPAPLAEPPLPAPDTALPAWPEGEDFAWVCAGATSPATGVRGRAAYKLLATLLGSSPSSLLYRKLRGEESLSYSFASWDRAYAGSGVWRLLAGVEPASAGRLVDIVRSLLTGIAEGRVDPEDLRAARRKTEMKLVLQAETPLDQAILLGTRTGAGVREWSVESARAELAAVTAEDISAAAAAVLDGLVVAVRPEAS